MATYTAETAVHPTLTANTMDTVTLTDQACDEVTIFNYGTTGTIYVRADGPDPTVAGDNTAAVPASTGVCVATGNGTKVVKLICSSANAYSVQTSPFVDGDD